MGAIYRHIDLDWPNGRQEIRPLLMDVVPRRKELDREPQVVRLLKDLVGVGVHEELATHQTQEEDAGISELLKDVKNRFCAQLVVGFVILITVGAIVVAPIGNLKRDRGRNAFFGRLLGKHHRRAEGRFFHLGILSSGVFNNRTLKAAYEQRRCNASTTDGEFLNFNS